LQTRAKTPAEREATGRLIAYNAGRDMRLKGWAKACPYVKGGSYAKCWWRGWYDAEKILANQ